MPRRRTAFVFVSLSFLTGFVASSAAAKSWKPIDLERVMVGSSDVLAAPGGRGVLAVPISNKSADPQWVAMVLGPPAPAPEQSAHMKLDAHRDTIVTWPQDAFAAEADYVITVVVFADSAMGDTLESGSTRGRLSKKDVETLVQWLEASTLPKAFKNVEKADKVTAGTSMMSMLGAPRGNGTLTVDSTGVAYESKKGSIVIPASALRDVRINNSNPEQPWVVVAYEQDGEKKTVSFKPNVCRGNASASQILAAIQAAMAGPATGK